MTAWLPGPYAGHDDGPEPESMHEEDPRWDDPRQPHGLARLSRDDSDRWSLCRRGESWAGATVHRWCAECRCWTHVADAGVPVDWALDDSCASCGRPFPLEPTA